MLPLLIHETLCPPFCHHRILRFRPVARKMPIGGFLGARSTADMRRLALVRPQVQHKSKHNWDRTSTVLLAAAKSRTLELLALDEYCSFDTSAFF
jgi:hypothetical protein